MKKGLILVSALMSIFLIGFIAGCSEDDQPPGIGGNPGAVQSIELRVTQTLVSGLVGTQHTQTITAIARNSSGVGIPNVRITFGIRDPMTYKGTIATSAADSVTNENGQVTATYSVVFDQSTDVAIEARVGQVFTTRTITLVARESIGNISLIAERSVLNVPPGQTRTVNVTATLADTDGLAIPGVEVNFKTRPATMGYVDSDTGMTSSAGRVQRVFSSIVDQYGRCEVIASVGNIGSESYIEAVTAIEIRPVAGPEEITIRTDTPVIKVAEGQNASAEIEAYVVDGNGTGVPGTTVEFKLEPLTEGVRTFGTLTPRDTTDADGKIVTTFQSLGKYGQEWIVATVLPSTIGEDAVSAAELPKGSRINLKSGGKTIAEITDEELLTARILITVENLPDIVRSLTISATPNFFNLPPDSTGRSIVRAVVRDQNRNGIPNLQIEYNADFGTLSRPTLTDSTGMSQVDFSVLPITDLLTMDEPTTITVTASIPRTNWTRNVNITVIPSRSDRGSLALTTDSRFIYADRGLTVANLQAVLKDEDGQVLSGRQIVFTSTHGVVNSPVITDSSGVARAVFADVGVPSFDENGNPDSAVVTAKYSPMGVETSVRIMIGPQNPVANISLVTGSQQMVAGRNDSTVVRATAFLANGQPAPNGTIVRFERRLGSFTQEAVPVAGDFGAAETFYIAGRIVGTDTLQAWVDNDGIRVNSNAVTITLISGPPSQIALNATPRTLTTNDPDAFSMITAVVMDTVGNRIKAGQLVTFTTTLGTVTPSTITNDEGVAIGRLTPGVEAGTAQIQANVEIQGGTQISAITTVTFVSGTPNSIELEADPLEIEVAGGGGQQFSTLRATVRDANGNVIEAPTTVVFQLINEPPPPAGCNINNRGQRDSTRTANGVAVVSLNSGTQVGGKLIRAYTWRDSLRQDTVSTILPRVAVVAGPPFDLDIDVNDAGTDVGGGSWVIEVSARIWDQYRNPVADRIPVIFSITEQNASITPGYTGNDGRNGSPTRGIAYADLVYHSLNTFNDIEITATVQAPGGIITGSRIHKLPLQQGELELNVDPANWMFSGENPQATIRVWAILKDGHQILINDAPILFTTNRARFYYIDNRGQYREYYPEASRKYTGSIGEENGTATVYLRAIEPNIFLDPFTLEVTVQINATVEGYLDVSADPAFIFFTRGGE